MDEVPSDHTQPRWAKQPPAPTTDAWGFPLNPAPPYGSPFAPPPPDPRTAFPGPPAYGPQFPAQFAGPTPAQHPGGGRSRKSTIVIALVIGLALGGLGSGALWYFTRTATAQDSVVSVPLTFDAMSSFIGEHYALLPGDYDQAWSRLSPEIQQEVGGYREYQDFWMTVRSVSVQSIQPRDSHSITYTLRVTYENGDVGTEIRWAEIRKRGNDLVLYRISATDRSVEKANSGPR